MKGLTGSPVLLLLVLLKGLRKALIPEYEIRTQVLKTLPKPENGLQIGICGPSFLAETLIPFRKKSAPARRVMASTFSREGPRLNSKQQTEKQKNRKTVRALLCVLFAFCCAEDSAPCAMVSIIIHLILQPTTNNNSI